eukprot:TRINITY_DN16350_c0_g1_i4.p1 TRINITY_DN16350_c0_g1~~TRINITY_DN16350_c0_g1_i4.p1  ORF type:complete len:994 (+),score=166.97 TRINITY_DN16350_c0_g1_i4:89-3070(+)
MPSLDAVWKEFFDGCAEGNGKQCEKGRDRLVFKDDSAFCDLGSVQRQMSSRVDAEDPELVVAMRTFQKGDGDGSEVYYADSHAFHSRVYDERPNLFNSLKKAKVDKSKLFLPPSEEIEAVDVYCDSLQKDAVANMVKRSKVSHEKALPQLREKVLKLKIKGTSASWTEEHLEKMLLWIRDEAPIIIHIPFDADQRMEKLLKDTHFRNQFETKISRGTLDYSTTGSRAGWEDRIFDKKYSTAEPFQRPKYGCLNIVNDPRGISSATSYGDSYIILKKCRLRTSFADKDSSCTDAQIASCEYHAHVLNKYSDAELQRVLEVSNRMRLWHKSDVVHTYKEVQIHGEIRLSENIDLVVLHEKYKKNTRIVSLMEEFCDKNNCKYIFMPSYTDAESTYKGDLWEMAGTEKPEGFLAENKPLPAFLTTGDDDECVEKPTPSRAPSPKSDSDGSVPRLGSDVLVRSSASTCSNARLVKINPATGMYTCTSGGKETEHQPEDISWKKSFVGTGLKYCMGDMVHARKKGASSFAPAFVHRIERSGLVGVIFEDDKKRSTVSVSPKDVYVTGYPVSMVMPAKDSALKWESGNRVLVEYEGFQCHPGVVKSSLPHSQYHVALDSGEVISCGSHRMSDEPETAPADKKVPEPASEAAEKYKGFYVGLAVHARYTHKTAHPAIIVKVLKDGFFSVRFMRNDALPSPESVHGMEIRAVGARQFPTVGAVPGLDSELVGSDMFYMDWAEPEEAADEVVKKMVTEAYSDSESEMGFDIFADDDGGTGTVEEAKPAASPPPPAPKPASVSSSSAMSFDLFGSDGEEEAPAEAPTPPPGHWACPACTFFNADHRPKCSICDGDRPAHAIPEPESEAESEYSSDYASETSLPEEGSGSTAEDAKVGKPEVRKWETISSVRPRPGPPRAREPTVATGNDSKPTLAELCTYVAKCGEGGKSLTGDDLQHYTENALKVREQVLEELIACAAKELEATKGALRSKVKSCIKEATRA